MKKGSSGWTQSHPRSCGTLAWKVTLLQASWGIYNWLSSLEHLVFTGAHRNLVEIPAQGSVRGSPEHNPHPQLQQC